MKRLMQPANVTLKQVAELSRCLAKAPSSESALRAVHAALQQLAPVQRVRFVFAETPSRWQELTICESDIETVSHGTCPPCPAEGLSVPLDLDNAATGFLWADSSHPPIAAALEVVAPQLWTTAMLHTLVGRVQESSTIEGGLVREVLRARDEERRRIACELHDDLGQSIASLKLSLKWAQDIISRKGDTNAAVAELESARESAGALLGKVRDLSHAIYPRILDTLGLHAAIQELVHQAERTSGMRFECSLHGTEQQLSRETSVALYRCCQEAVSNALRHSEASTVRVDLATREAHVHLTVEDDGKGFDPRTLYDSSSRMMSSGFWTIRQRVNDLDGSFRVSTGEGQGMAIEIIIPVNARNTDEQRKDTDTGRG